MKLEEFFTQKPEDTLSMLKSVELRAEAGGQLIFLTNKPWWTTGESAEFSLSFERVSEVSLLDAATALVQTLCVDTQSPLLWNYQPQGSIFGHAPLPDPPRFFHEFYELVVGTLGIKRDPIDYLNWQKNFLGWRNIVLSRAYQLLHAPWQVVEASTLLLDAQVADYNPIPDRDVELPSDPPEIALEFGDSWVLGSGLKLEY